MAIDYNGMLHGSIGAVIGVAGSIAVTYLNRVRPVKIVCEVLNASPSVNFAHNVQSDVAMTYKGTPVSSLAIAEIAIINDGRTLVENLDLNLVFPEKTTVLEINEVLPGGREGGATVSKTAENKIQVSAAYLNSLKDHRDKILLKLVCDGPIEPITAVGRGKGWSVTTRRTEDVYVAPRLLLALLTCVFVLIAIWSIESITNEFSRSLRVVDELLQSEFASPKEFKEQVTATVVRLRESFNDLGDTQMPILITGTVLGIASLVAALSTWLFQWRRLRLLRR